MSRLSPRPQTGLRMAWGLAAVAALGLGLVFIWPPAAVALTFVAALLCVATVINVTNLPSTRWANFAAAALHAIALGWASGSTLLGLTVLLPLWLMVPTERAVTQLGYRAAYVMPVIELVALGLFAAARRTDAWALGAVPALLTGAIFATIIPLWTRAMRRIGPARWPIGPGDPAPAVRATARDGTEFDLERERGRWVLLCFLRGDWCPVCQVMMRLYKRNAAALASRNVKLVAVSPLSGTEAQDFAREFGIDYAVLVDPDLAIARTFGAVHPKDAPGGLDTALPVSFLVDPQGIVRAASRSDDVGSFDDPLKVLAQAGG